MNHFLDLLYDSFVLYFTLSVGLWVICCTHAWVDVEGFAKVFPCFASERSILVRYYVLWHTLVWVYVMKPPLPVPEPLMLLLVAYLAWSLELD